MWKFAKAICEDRPIAVYNNGDMRRDFTYIDDIVSGVLAVADQTPARAVEDGHRLYNIGNNKPEALMDLIGFLERGLGKEAEKEFLPMQLGDVKETFADISRISGDYGFAPTTSLEVGVAKFVDWFKANNAHLY
ncbi:MAG: NAD-dependent epimerase/dehydratase family protein [Rhodobacteraceae bacterium]|nr:NAD-dependent epimerase/dehydratase family protein [Paracoccaceae bacterium]